MGLETRRGFVPNHREFGMHIRSEVARKPALQIATQIAAVANAIVSVQGPNKREGKRRAAGRPAKGSYTLKKVGNINVAGNFRAYAEVESRVPSAIALEGGGKHTHPQRPLLKAALAVCESEIPGGYNVRGD